MKFRKFTTRGGDKVRINLANVNALMEYPTKLSQTPCTIIQMVGGAEYIVPLYIAKVQRKIAHPLKKLIIWK